MHEKIGFVAALIFVAYLAYQDIREQRVSVLALIIAGSASILYLAAGEQLNPVQVICRSLPGVLLLFVALLSKEEIGYGDGITVLVMGLWIGMVCSLLVVCIGLFLAGICGTVLLVKGNREKQIPFVPFLLTAMEVLLIYV